MECEFCKSVLKTKSSLNYHNKNNKKCLEIQSKIVLNIDSALIKCEFCGKSFSATNINKHTITCKIKKKIDNDKGLIEFEILQNKNKEIEELNKKLVIKNNTLTSENEKLINDIEKLSNENKSIKDYIIKLETENSIYKKDHETISDIAKQPKNNTTNNIINNLCVYDDNEIKNRFSAAISNIKPSDLYDGQKSIGRFVVPCLKNDDGTKMLSCTDYARNVFIYKDKNGNINKDIKCKNLVDLIEPIASAKADQLLKEDCIIKEKSYRLTRLYDQVNKRHNEIKDLRNHLLGFEKNTKKWKHISGLIEKKVNENEMEIKEIEELENEGIIMDNEDNDIKLVFGADDIKDMKNDSVKFSKVISGLG